MSAFGLWLTQGSSSALDLLTRARRAQPAEGGYGALRAPCLGRERTKDGLGRGEGARASRGPSELWASSGATDKLGYLNTHGFPARTSSAHACARARYGPNAGEASCHTSRSSASPSRMAGSMLRLNRGFMHRRDRNRASAQGEKCLRSRLGAASRDPPHSS